LGTQRDDRPKGVQILRRSASVGYQDDHRETAKLNRKQRENLGGKERDPLQFLDQANHSLVSYPMFHKLDQPIMLELVEKGSDVQVENPVHILAHDSHP
jgi:hypothetical protein